MRAIAVLALLALAACGVEGRPTAPNGTTPGAVVSLSGSAQVGVGANL